MPEIELMQDPPLKAPFTAAVLIYARIAAHLPESLNEAWLAQIPNFSDTAIMNFMDMGHAALVLIGDDVAEDLRGDLAKVTGDCAHCVLRHQWTTGRWGDAPRGSRALAIRDYCRRLLGEAALGDDPEIDARFKPAPVPTA